jgi:hypothetical protein
MEVKMKKFCILMFALLSFCNAKTQSCLPEGITFTTQSQIDNFQINYPNCTQIAGDVEITGSNITNLNGLTILTSIVGGLIIQDNPNLISLSGLNNLSSIGFILFIDNNTNLTSLTGLGSLITIGGLSIGVSTTLISLSGLDNVISIGASGLEIIGNQSLIDLTGLEGVSTIQGGLYFSGSSLTSLAGLNSVTSLGGGIAIDQCPNLTNFQPLNHLTSIPGSIYLINNNNLTNLSGLDQVTSIGDYIYIKACPNLMDLSGLGKVTSIGGKLYISNNANLIDFNGLNSLKSIGGEVFIDGCNHLNSLSALSNVTSIVGQFMIYVNPSLTSLAGIDNIDYTTISGLTIYYNINLCSCAVKSVCDYIVTPNSNCLIYGNATGCHDTTEVIDACLALFTNDLKVNPALEIYPNPSSGNITIEVPEISIKEYLSISNLYGQELQKQLITDSIVCTDISCLPSGVYVVKVQAKQKAFVGKFIKN